MALNPRTVETVGREISAERWRDAQKAYRSSDGFSLRLGDDRGLQVFTDGLVFFHRLIGNATIGAGLPVPFPDLLADILALLRFAERVYPQIAGDCAKIDVRCSLVNIFERPLDLQLDLEDQMLGGPRREGEHSVAEWFSEPVTFEIGQDDPILVTRTMLAGLFWIMGYENFERYLSRWGRKYERPVPPPTPAGDAPPVPRQSRRALAERLATLVRNAGFEVFYDGFRSEEQW